MLRFILNSFIFLNFFFLNFILINNFIGSYAKASTVENRDFILHFTASDQGKKILSAGEKLHYWIQLINEKRQKQSEPVVTLYVEGDAYVYGYENPYFLGPFLILSKMKSLMDEMPQEMQEILFSATEPPNTVPKGINDEVFASLARSFKRIYLEVISWKDVEENYEFYRDRATRDVRPYYLLKKMNGLEQKFVELNKTLTNEAYNLSEDEVSTIRKALVGMCLATRISINICEEELDTKIKNKSVESMYQRYLYLAEYWIKFPFRIQPGKRNSRIHLDPSQKQIIVPFYDPIFEVKKNYSKEGSVDFNYQVERVRNFIKENIEAEFALNGWQVIIQFTDDYDQAAVEFQFVEGSYAACQNTSIIRMGKLESFDDAYTKWTIQHEFGHVLGFEDCYLRFIDRENPSQVVYYSLDEKNLMCAIWGRFNETMLKEIISTYKDSL
ncbi:MAG: hypothetical protein K1X29_09240 [Bdellovibrionales bacterium]|nr:hypothetical protein [Bdellovibrionales bacterium]